MNAINESVLLHAFVVAGIWCIEAMLAILSAWFLTKRIRQNAAFRHAIWLIAFCALLLIPLCSVIVPTLVLVRTSVPLRVVSQSHVNSIPSLPERQGDVSVASPRRYGTPVRLGLLEAWVTGFGILVLHGIASLMGLRYLYARSEKWLPEGGIALNSDCEVRISQIERPSTPMTWGVLRPIVLLPKGADLWPRQKLEAVLLHEFSHVQRRDYASQLFVSLICALYWFLPPVWMAARAIRAEAEAAADDLVLGAGILPSYYAAQLLWFAAQSRPAGRWSPRPALGVALLADQQSKLEARILRIVSPAVCNSRKVTLHQVIPVMGMGMTAILLLASVKPLVSVAHRRSEPVAALESTPLLASAVRRSLRPSKLVLPHRAIHAVESRIR